MSIAVLVATKNRPDKLTKLLESLTLSTNFISQIVIVSSGQNISQVIANFSDSLNIKHLHSEVSGQITQKMQGIKHIDQSIKWVLFLDDDITISEQAFETLINRYLRNPKFTEVYGFGLKINNIEFRKYTRRTKTFLRTFGLYSNKSGSVLKSGHAQTYQDSLSDIETQWLNGISIWRVEALKSYGSRFQAINYAAYEDVIFSYRVSRNNRLIFASTVPVVNQDVEKYIRLTFTQYKAGSYMRYLFVTENRNLSKSILLIAQLFRTFDFTINGDLNIPILKRFLKSFFIWCDLFLAIIIKVDPINLLNKRYLNSQ
jgi:glycosyltransferase involved in cell wall biosynthesis